MRSLFMCAALCLSAVAQGSNFEMDSAKPQILKVERCSNAAFIAVSILEDSDDGVKQHLALTGALAGLSKGKLGEATPTALELKVTHQYAYRESIGMPRPFGKREHDWLIAQAAGGCVMWMPLEG
ncbi:hypothetical protein [Pseudomonas soli]|uniref:hypothetical protein n=1 Tax=Pseudomonas soli TaxID=1306993 RepID=UPI003DA96F9C